MYPTHDALRYAAADRMAARTRDGHAERTARRIAPRRQPLLSAARAVAAWGAARRRRSVRPSTSDAVA